MSVGKVVGRNPCDEKGGWTATRRLKAALPVLRLECKAAWTAVLRPFLANS